MIRPAGFGANPETAASNRFQRVAPQSTEVSQAATTEFDAVVRVLTEAGIGVEVFDDTPEPWTPDAVFPNNWISFHADGAVCLYPMQAQNRRRERRPDVLQALEQERGYRITRIEDLSDTEQDGRYLEGTGSLVLDRTNRVAYAGLSPRTDEQLVHTWCRSFDYEPVIFRAAGPDGAAIYHTNVMMCIGERFAIACLDSIPNPIERKRVSERLEATGHQLVPIGMEQMLQFAANMLLLHDRDDNRILVMSTRAERALTDQQRKLLQKSARIVSSPLNTIEDCAGGSMRCMIAELLLPRK